MFNWLTNSQRDIIQDIIQKIRAIILIALAILLLLLFADYVFRLFAQPLPRRNDQLSTQQQQQEEFSRDQLRDAIRMEARMAVLETKQDNFSDQLKSLQTYQWGLLLGMSGLVGEAGIRLAGKKRKSMEEEE